MLAKQTSKDGKVKSKNFNLFDQFSSGKKKAQKAVSSAEESQANDNSDDDDSEISQKLVKKISESINSYSLSKASNEDAQPKAAAPAAGSKQQQQEDSISDFSGDD